MFRFCNLSFWLTINACLYMICTNLNYFLIVINLASWFNIDHCGNQAFWLYLCDWDNGELWRLAQQNCDDETILLWWGFALFLNIFYMLLKIPFYAFMFCSCPIFYHIFGCEPNVDLRLLLTSTLLQAQIPKNKEAPPPLRWSSFTTRVIFCWILPHYSYLGRMSISNFY